MSTEQARDNRIRVTTLGDLLLSAADEHADSPAIVFPDFRLTYAELRDRAMHRARSLLALGIKRGEHVGILLPTCHQFPEIFFAVSLCGAVPVPVNARYQAHELAYVIDNGDLVTVITTDEIAEQVNFVERMSRGLPDIVNAGDPANISINDAPRLRSLVLLGQSAAPGIRFLVLDCRDVTGVDSSALLSVTKICELIDRNDGQLIISNLRQPIAARLTQVVVGQEVPLPLRCFEDVYQAMAWCEDRLLQDWPDRPQRCQKDSIADQLTRELHSGLQDVYRRIHPVLAQGQRYPPILASGRQCFSSRSIIFGGMMAVS